MSKCNCEICRTYRRYKWAVIKECPCSCHDNDDPSGHDSLCCEFPNGRKKDVPFKRLRNSSYYRKILNKIEQETEAEFLNEDKNPRREEGEIKP